MKSARNGIFFDVLPADADFTGRENELRKMDDLLSQKDTSDLVVCGLGGTGKTQLVRRYIEKLEEAKFKHIIWITADSESSINECFTRLAEDLLNISCVNASGKPKSIQSIVTDVYIELSKAETLMVFDDVECVDDIRNIHFRKTIPKGASIRPKVVITSRIQEWGRYLLIQLETLIPDEAEEFISKTLDMTISADVKALAERLQFFPLALRQATSYIAHERKRDNVTIASYLQLFNSQDDAIKTGLLESSVFMKDPGNKYNQTTFTTWSITVATIAKHHEHGTLAIKILNTIAFFAPQTFRRGLLFHIDKDYSNESKRTGERVKPAVSLLVEYSMIGSHESQTILQIHRLVQEVTRLRLSQERQDEAILRDGLQLFRDIVLRFEYAVHAASIFIHAGKYRDCLSVAMRGLPNAILVNLVCGPGRSAAKIFAERLCKWYFEDEVFIKQLEFHLRFAKDVLLRSDFKYMHLYEYEYDKKLESFGKSDSETLEVKFQIGFLYKEANKFAEALHILCEVYDIQSETLGESHVDTLRTQRIIGSIHLEKKDWDKASEVMNEIIKKEILVLGESHANTLLTRRCIGQIHFGKKEWRAAMDIFEEILAKQTESLGECHQDTTTTLSYIGRIHFERKEWDQAMHIFEKIVANQNGVVQEAFERGETSLDTCDQMTLLSRRYIGRIKLQKKHKAMHIFRDVYNKQKFSLGSYHHDTLLTKNYIGRIHFEEKEWSEAMSIFEEVYYKQKFALGECHQDTLLTKHDIGRIYFEKKEWCDARQIFEDIYCNQMSSLGECHQDTLLTKHDIGRIHFEERQWHDASKIFEEVYAKQKTLLGECHQNTLSTRHYIGRIHFEKKEWSDAKKIFEDVFAKEKISFGDCHQNTLLSRQYIGRIHFEQEEWNEAIEIFKEIFPKLKNLLGKHHLNTLLTSRHIGRIHYERKEWAEALEFFEVTFEIEKTLLGKRHPYTLITRRYIGEIYIATEQYDDAMRVFEQILAMKINLLGENSRSTQSTKLYIGRIYLKMKEWDKAMSFFKDALLNQMDLLGESHWETCMTKRYIRRTALLQEMNKKM